MLSVPWQAYPGHVPCPVPADQYGDLRYQWGEDWFDPDEVARKLDEDLRGYWSMLRAPAFPAHALSRGKLWLAYVLTRTRVSDYRYLLDSAQAFLRFGGANLAR
jgi:hypothetical protein